MINKYLLRMIKLLRCHCDTRRLQFREMNVGDIFASLGCFYRKESESDIKCVGGTRDDVDYGKTISIDSTYCCPGCTDCNSMHYRMVLRTIGEHDEEMDSDYSAIPG